MTIIAANLHNKDALAAHAAFTGITFCIYMVPLGLTFSVNSMIGNLAGAGKGKIAKNCAKVSLISTFLCVLVFECIGFLLKPLFVKCFTTDENMREYYKNIYTFYLLCYFFNDSF